jgi:microcin C transport system permease protein
MGAYILRRLLLMIPTIVGIMAISFAVVQFAPGGPVEQVISDLTNAAGSDRLSGNAGDLMPVGGGDGGQYRGAQGLDPDFIAKLEKQFGFDKPPLERFVTMMWDYARFDFGESFFRNTPVIDLIIQKMPVSISLGVWILIFSYAISIPLGIKKAVSDGSTSGPRASSSSAMRCRVSSSAFS